MYRYVMSFDECAIGREIIGSITRDMKVIGVMSDSAKGKSHPAKLRFTECRLENDGTIAVAGVAEIRNIEESEDFYLQDVRGKLEMSQSIHGRQEDFVFCNPVVDDDR